MKEIPVEMKEDEPPAEPKAPLTEEERRVSIHFISKFCRNEG